jgi:hypothetical protein
MAIRQDFYSPNFKDMGGEDIFNEGFVDPQAFMNYDSLVSASASAPSSAKGGSKQDIINYLTKQIQGSSDTSKWTGGYAASAAAKDMARILADTGITDISQFGPVTKEVDLYMGEGVDGTPIYQKQLEQTFGNKLTGQAVPVTYSERQTGNAFGGTFEGKGNTGYRVDFTPEGTPIFYTTGASSSNAGEIIKPFAQMALLAAGIGGLEALGLGAGGGAAAGGAATGAGATGAGLATAGELGTLAGMGGGTGLTAGASGLGLNAAGAGLGSLGTGAGITAGAGLTGTGVLTGSTLGTGLLGTGAGVAGLTGTGILAGSELGSALLGTTSTTPLVGSGVLSGSTLGAELLGTGANTAATVGGVTGLTNAANVGYGALNTGVSTGITGLGSGALNTGVNPSGASTTGIDPTTGAPPTGTPQASSNPLSNLSPAQLSSLINGALGLFGAVGAGKALSGGGGGSAPPRSIPTQGIPLNSEDYFRAIQQNYDRMLPAAPRDVATPLAQWYNSKYTGAK